MPITVLGMDGNPYDQNSIEPEARFLRSFVLFKLSGSYATGGDVLDLTNGGGTPAAPSVIPPAYRGLAQIDIRPICKTTSSFSAADGQYYVISPVATIPIPIANVNNLKLKLMLDIATEYTAGAYGTDALADIIIAELIWAR